MVEFIDLLIGGTLWSIRLIVIGYFVKLTGQSVRGHLRLSSENGNAQSASRRGSHVFEDGA